jgi:uncharacterized membrane protein YkvA (DUF1232 family)
MDKGSASIADDDIKKAAEKAERLKEKVLKSGALKKFINELGVLISLVKDYWNGSYRAIPYKAVGIIVFTLLYVLNIADVIPDVIPGVGLLDDASVIAFCLKIVNSEIEKYKEWKGENNTTPSRV